jgi:hypothetical protein
MSGGWFKRQRLAMKCWVVKKMSMVMKWRLARQGNDYDPEVDYG